MKFLFDYYITITSSPALFVRDEYETKEGAK